MCFLRYFSDKQKNSLDRKKHGLLAAFGGASAVSDAQPKALYWKSSLTTGDSAMRWNQKPHPGNRSPDFRLVGFYPFIRWYQPKFSDKGEKF